MKSSKENSAQRGLVLMKPLQLQKKTKKPGGKKLGKPTPVTWGAAQMTPTCLSYLQTTCLRQKLF